MPSYPSETYLVFSENDSQTFPEPRSYILYQLWSRNGSISREELELLIGGDGVSSYRQSLH